MRILLMTDGADNEVTFSRAGNRGFVAVLVLFVVFAFGYAVYLGLVQGIDFVLVLWLLREHPLIKQEVCLMTFEQTVTG